MNPATKQVRKPLWRYPWGYRESFFVALEILLIGLIFEALSQGKGIPPLRWPLNFIIGIVLLGGVIILQLRAGRTPLVRWLSSVPAAVSAISLFALLVLLLGFIPQGKEELPAILHLVGLSQLKQSWVFMLGGLYFLVSLGFVTVRRSRPLSRKNLGFLLNHGGLWIAIASGSLGAGDLQRGQIALSEAGEARSELNLYTGESMALPFAVRLLDFEMEQYPPKLGVVNLHSGELKGAPNPQLAEAVNGAEIELAGWHFQMIRYLPDARPVADSFVVSNAPGSVPAVLVQAGENTDMHIRDWVTCGSQEIPPRVMMLDDHHYLGMTFPEPKQFSSMVILDHSQRQDTLRIEVNRPLKAGPWKFYQASYDEAAGKWSEWSILEAVRDPWLPLVYLGIFMMLAGAAYLFWTGNRLKEEE